ncbi:Intracellular serine protease [Brevundimonas sp. SH203]|uniref:S8 family serine peptidase n=1 Tax=Brevundimonas sp. SH203 TaxID=345167 RepID=UPI0009D4B6C6|nr:S8 family serine peptidase [Brevundimonas sp. SH203]GAW39661.1 Intracellular serine protease [Brevundimonas sp. SH203]
MTLKEASTWIGLAVLTLTPMAAAVPAQAQIGPLPTPILPSAAQALPDRLTAGLEGVDRLARQTADQALTAPARLAQLVRRSDGALEADPLGWPVVRGEIVTLDLSPSARARAVSAGFTVLREERLEALDIASLVLAPPRGLSLARAAALLRRWDAEAEITFNHVHDVAGPLSAAEGARVAGDGASGIGGEGVTLGLIDTGVEATHPALTGSRIVQRGFAGPPRMGAHGLAVASLMVGRSGPFVGGAPGADLRVADIYGGQAAGGASTALAQAMAWMVEQQADVVNISLVGPRNALVERAIQRAQARGLTVVAAVGNDGPAAPPLYPAAYDGVIGVTAVNARDQVLPEAGRGPQVAFAAPGADMAAAAPAGRWTSVRGTSFAAPIVAGLLAREGEAALARDARDIGARGRDTTYGLGLVGVGSRVAPQAMGARGRLSR